MVVNFETNKFAESKQKEEILGREDKGDKRAVISGLTASEFWAHQRANRLQRT